MSTLQTYTGYSETDTASRLTVAANTLTIASLDTDEDMRLTYDFGASYFSGDFEHTLKINVTVGTGTEECYVWAMTDSVANPIGVLITANTDLIALKWSNATLVLLERNSTVTTSDTSSALSLATDYYLRVVRDEAVGTYGTLYCYIYTDREYCKLVDTLTVTLTETTMKDWRYLWACSSVGDGAGSTVFTGTIASLTLDTYAYTLEGVRTQARDLLNESVANFWTDAELNYWVNDGIREIAEFTGCIQNIDSLSTTNGTRTISYTGYDCQNVEYVPASGNRISLVQSSPLQDGHNQYDGTAPQYWWVNKGVIGIDPVPDATYNLLGYIAGTPTDITIGSQIPEIPPAFRALLKWYVCYRAYLKEHNYGAASLCHQIYQSEMIYLAQDLLANVPDARSEMRYPQPSPGR